MDSKKIQLLTNLTTILLPQKWSKPKMKTLVPILIM